MKKNQSVGIIASIGIIISMVLALSACSKPGENESSRQGANQAVEVSVMEIKPEHVTIATELSGRVSAFLVAEVRPQVGGIIQKMLFTEGSEVNEGDVLYQIDPALFKAAYDSAKASLARAESILPPARSKAERYKELAMANAISQQEYDDADAAAKKAEADILSAKAEMEKAQINLEYTSVKAPISGRIGKSSVTTGALVTAFQAVALSTIQKLDPVYVDVTQSSSSMLHLKKSMEKGLIKKDADNQARVKMLLEDGTPYSQEGVLKFSDVTVDPGTGSVILRSVFPNPELTLLPGMFVRALVEEGVNENAILVPQRCVTRNAKGIAVAMIVDTSDMAQTRELQIDRAVGNSWLVSDGLTEGDKVIVEGLQKIRPGSPVKTMLFGAEERAAERNSGTSHTQSPSGAEK
ncbi:MAG: efflux RND transporter periplasmic adaptor subunit [Proteobacteria bacterium]|nr:efflux RND transporter periplasmic adaptor subunit [Pseudomonadota bacterium]